MGLKWMGTWEGFDPAQPGTRRFATRNDAPCAVSATTDLVSAMLATGFPYDVHSSADDNLLSFATLLKRVRAIRRCGAAAMDLCHVAEGTFDAYWERKLKPWDLAAGAAIVIAAGGRVTAMDGAPLGGHGHSRGRPLLHHGHTLASNGRLHALVTEALAGTFPADDVSESLP
jgi:myo-inositol-1(or 4)-monophosphatase